MADDSNISGGRELDAFLQTLSAKIEQNIMRSALSAGARVIAKEAKRTAPVGPPSDKNVAKYGGYAGALRDSVRVSSRAKNGTVTASVKVGGKGGKSRGADVFYAHMVEFGTAAHGIKKGASRKRGKLQGGLLHPGMAARPFVRPAFDSKASEAIAAVTAQIRKRLTKEGINVPAPTPEIEE